MPISLLLLEDSDLDADLELSYFHFAKVEVLCTRVQYHKDFISALETKTFDLILADYSLPDFDGLEALAIAREKAPRTPFIFVSGVIGEETAIDSLRNGATDYVLKRRMDRLVPAVQRAIAEARERAERRHMESALVESESRFRNMADFAPVMIWTVEPDKSWNYCNKPWLEFTGLTAEQSSGLGWTALVHPHDLSRVLETYDRAFETRQEFTLEYRFRRSDGHYRSIVNRAVPRTRFEGEFAGFIGSCTDITELKSAEGRLNAAKLESLGILAGGIAHDFNNLLTGIMGNTSLVLEDLPPDSTAVQYLQEVVRASETAARLTRQMLAYAGKGQFVLEQVDVSRVVRETLPLIESALPRLVRLKLDVAQNLPAVEADPGQVQQLVMNLVINAAEAASSGSSGLVTIWTSLEVLDDAGTAAMLAGFPVLAGRYIVLRVKDNGCGMNEETKNRIFDPFFSTKFTGRGLGLAAVSGIVRSHRGGISLASEPGAGSDFRVYLRVSTAVTTTAARVEVQRAASGSGTILVVDDESIVSRTARQILEKFGYQVIIARDGQEGVDLFRAHASEIDLVLLDMDMPVMPGEIAFPQIRAIRPNMPVIVTSGFDEAEAVRRFGSDIDTFLQKPYTAVQLINKVHASRRA